MLKIIKFNILSKLVFIVLIVLSCSFVYASQIRSLTSLDSISDILQANEEFNAVVPHSIFSTAKYTSSLDKFCFLNYEIKIDRIENYNKFFVKISKLDQNRSPASDAEKNNTVNIEQQLPWWSKSAPTELKQLDLSNIDGSKDFYDLGKGYQLSLLKNQGHWGKVYLLEHFLGARGKKICAVKLILSRSDRKLSLTEFHKRHLTEVENNIKILSLAIAVKPYGIIRNDGDHYLLFMEYGVSGRDHFKTLSSKEIIREINNLFKDVAKMHDAGYAHGDLKIDNILIVKNKIKLCDWFSLNEYNKSMVGEFRYIGDNLPPEAICANYLKEDKALQYAIINSKEIQSAYILHPITSDRFCLAVSVLEVLEPDLFKKITYTPKDFNPWAPKSLKFYPHYVNLIRETQTSLLERAKLSDDHKKKALYKQISKFLDVDPMKRIIDS